MIIRGYGRSMSKTLEEACDHIENNLDKIAVREQVNGKIGSYYLSELPSHLAIKHAFRLLTRMVKAGE